MEFWVVESLDLAKLIPRKIWKQKNIEISTLCSKEDIIINCKSPFKSSYTTFLFLVISEGIFNREKWFSEPLKAVDLAGEFFEQIEAAQKNPSFSTIIHDLMNVDAILRNVYWTVRFSILHYGKKAKLPFGVLQCGHLLLFAKSWNVNCG